jgi:CheY-like chemotaxis protein
MEEDTDYKILYLEDNLCSARLVKSTLEKALNEGWNHFRINHVENVKKAHEYMFKSHPERTEYDCLIVDLDLGLRPDGSKEVSGFEFIRDVRNDERTKNIPIVICSGTRSNKDRVFAQKHECGFSSKPLDLIGILREMHSTAPENWKDKIEQLLIRQGALIE